MKFDKFNTFKLNQNERDTIEIKLKKQTALEMEEEKYALLESHMWVISLKACCLHPREFYEKSHIMNDL